MNAPEQRRLHHRGRDSALTPDLALLDDATLLAHFRTPRAARFHPVADPEHTGSEKIEAIMAGRFEFNGERHELPDPIDWLDNPSRDIEWHILLHKFYYAVGLGERYAATGEAAYANRWMQLIDGWMECTPHGFIASDVTGRRVQNWIYSYHHFVSTADRNHIDAGFHRRLLESLAAQADYLCRNLTAGRNHRTLELYAIFLASLAFPEMARAEFWREFSLQHLVDNIASDLRPDGVHIEQSTDYHHLVVKNYLNVRRLASMNEVALPAAFDASLQRALEFSMHVHKPDGIVPSLSDGDARSFTELLALGAEFYRRDDFLYVATAGAKGRPPKRRNAHFPDSGYSVLRGHWGTGGQRYRDAQYLVFDYGPLGEGNHGHFDCLSFELAAFGRSLIVDPGRYTYSEGGAPNWRVRFRGTEAHNTVSVDGQNQTLYLPQAPRPDSDPMAGTPRHRIAGPPHEATLHERVEHKDLVLLCASVRSHAYDALHTRRLLFVDGSYWIVSDCLAAPSRHHYVLRFQLGEAAQGAVERARGDAPLIRSPGLLLAQPANPEVRFRLESSWVSSRYGEKRAAPRLCFSTWGEHSSFDTVLMPWEGSTPPLSVQRLPVSIGGAEAGRAAGAILIEGEAASTAFRDLWFHSRRSLNGTWTFDGYTFEGRWLWLREVGDGRITRAYANADARLCYRGMDVPLGDAP